MKSVLWRPWALVVLLWCAVLGSAAAAVYTRHHARELFVELERLHRERDQLDTVYGQSQLEQNAFSAHAYVESTATASLGMRTPDPAKIQLVTP